MIIKKLLWITMLFIVILASSLVLALDYEINTSTQGSTASSINTWGNKFITLFPDNGTYTLINVNVSAVTCNLTSLYNSTRGTLTTAPVINGSSTFNYVLQNNTYYYIVCNKNGATYTVTYSSVMTFPQARSIINWTHGYDSAVGDDTNYFRNIKSITINKYIYCANNWSKSYSECIDSSRLILWTDINNCDDQSSLPSTNGTYEYCAIPPTEGEEAIVDELESVKNGLYAIALSVIILVLIGSIKREQK